MLGVSLSWLNKARVRGGGPIFVKFRRSVRYAADDLAAFIAKRRRTSTSDPGHAR